MRSSRIRFAVGMTLCFAAAAPATPLRMEYCKTAVGGGLFKYEFSLILDNNDGTWSAGQGFGWVIFGDAPSPGPSPMIDFVMDPSSFPVGPFTELWTSSGGHNGPNLAPITAPVGGMLLWEPGAVGQSLKWKGTSAANMAPGQMLWTNLFAGGGASVAEFIVANEVACPGQCYPDCNNSGSLTVADFTCFQGQFLGQTAYGDCNNSGTWTVADFTCFQVAYLNGCP